MASNAQRVLVAEDDPVVREYLASALEHGGYAVVGVRDAAGARECAAEGGFAAILIDGLLPDMHGADLARELALTTSPDVPICLLSGALSADIEPHAGIAALVKPTRPSQLNAILAQLIAWTPSEGDDDERREVLAQLGDRFSVRP